MAEVTHFYAENNSLVTNSSATGPFGTSGTLVTVPGSSLSATTKYLIIARALVGSSSATNRVGIHVWAPDDSTINTKSQTIYEMQQASSTALKSYLFVHSFTTDASPADVRIGIYRDGDTGSDVHGDQASLLLIDLDDSGTEGTEYHEDINAATGTELPLVGALVTLASIDAADTGTTEEWLALGCAKIGVGSTGVNYNVVLSTAIDESTPTTKSGAAEEGEDTAEERMVGLFSRHKAITTSSDIKIQAWEDANNGNHTDEGSYLIALKASAFADFEFDYDNTNRQPTSETTMATVGPYTPTTSGNHLILGATETITGVGANVHLHLEDGTTPTRTGDSIPTHDQAWDTGKDDEIAYTMERISISAEKTYNLRALVDSSLTLHQSHLYILNLNLAAGEVISEIGAILNAVSTVVPVLNVERRLVADVTDVSTATAALTQTHNLQATSTSASSVTADLTNIVLSEIGAIVTAESSVEAALIQTNDLATTSSASSTVVVSLTQTNNAAATVTSASAASALLTVERELAATINSASTVVADLTQTSNIAATVTAVSSVVADLTQTNNAAAVVDAESGIVTALTQTHILTTDVASASAVTANLSNVEPGASLIAAIVTGVSTVVAGLNVTTIIDATIDAESSVVAALTQTNNLAATANGVSAVTADLTNTAISESLIGAIIDSQSSIVVGLNVTTIITATATGASGATVGFTQTHLLDAISTAASTIDASVTQTHALEASPTAVSGMSINLSTQRVTEIAATIASISAVAVAVLRGVDGLRFITLNDSSANITVNDSVQQTAVGDSVQTVNVGDTVQRIDKQDTSHLITVGDS